MTLRVSCDISTNQFTRCAHSVCANRIFVQDSVYDAFAAKLAVAVRAFKVGEGAIEGITHGPLIHKAAVDKVARHVEDAKSKGAKVLVGGERLDVPGHFFQVRFTRSLHSLIPSVTKTHFLIEK